MGELHRAGDPELGEARDVGGIEALRVLDPLAEPERLPGVLRRLERVEGVAVRAVADCVHGHGPAGVRPRAGSTSSSSSRLVISTPEPSSISAVCEPERAVHERLHVAEAEEVVAEARAQRERGELREPVGRERLPDPQRQALALVDPAEDRGRAEPAVLVVDRRDAAGVRDPDALARRLDPLVLGHGDEALAEAPGRLLAQDPGGRSVGVRARRPRRARRGRRRHGRGRRC